MREFVGTWWLPSEPDHKVAGTLVVNDDGELTLTLIGGFNTRTSTPVGANTYEVTESIDSFGIVLGHADPHREVTLIDCLIASNQLTLGDAPLNQKWRPARALAGLHILDSTANDFVSATVELEGFHAWAGTGRFGITATPEAGDGRREVSVPQRRPIEFASSGWSFKVRHRVDPFRTRHHHDHSEVVSAQRTFIDISCDEAVPYDGFDSVVSALADLASFASRDACAIASYAVQHRVPQRRRRPVPGDNGSLRFDEYESPAHAEVFANWYTAPRTEGAPRPTRTYLFTASDLDLETLVTRWLEIRARLDRGIDMLLSLRYGEPTFLQTEVLVLAVAAEAIHRRLYPDCLLTYPGEFEHIRETAMAKLNAAEREMFDHTRNEPSYRDRLRDLATLPVGLDKKSVGTVLPDLKKWVRDLTDVRNGLAHALTRRPSTDDFELLVDMRRRTEHFIEILILAELGLSAEVQRRALRQRGYYVGFDDDRGSG